MISISSHDAESHIAQLISRLKGNIQLWSVIGQKAHRYIASDHFREEKNRDGSSWPTWAGGAGYRLGSKRGVAGAFSRMAKTGRTSKKSIRAIQRGDKLLVDSGLMRKTIYWSASQDRVDIKSPARYSKYHHTGTRHMPKREFMFIKRNELGNIVSYMIREMFRGL